MALLVRMAFLDLPTNNSGYPSLVTCKGERNIGKIRCNSLFSPTNDISSVTLLGVGALAVKFILVSYITQIYDGV